MAEEEVVEAAVVEVGGADMVVEAALVEVLGPDVVVEAAVVEVEGVVGVGVPVVGQMLLGTRTMRKQSGQATSRTL